MTEAGDEAGTAAWLEQLRRRFVAVAGRRVAGADVEDLVQDAMHVVLERGMRRRGSDQEELPLEWCFQVLRNTIGNHYRKTRRRSGMLSARTEGPPWDAAASPPTPLEALESSQGVRIITEALDAFDMQDGICARMLRSLMSGVSPAALAARESVEEKAFYRRIYRCRNKLRSLLRTKGVVA